MYGVAITWNMDVTRAADQQRVLQEEIVTSVSKTPGFVSGYWTANPSTGKSYTFTIVESEEAANTMMKGVQAGHQDAERHGARLETIGIGEIVAKA